MREAEVKVPPGETCGRVTPEEWAGGVRYVSVLLGRFYRKRQLPKWADPVGLYEAGMEGLVAATRSYDPTKARWTTYMHAAIWQRMEREWLYQQNWQQLRAKSSPYWEAKDFNREAELEPLASLDFPLPGRDGKDGDLLADLVPADVDVEAEALRGSDRDRIQYVLGMLQPRHRAVLLARAEGRGLRELAREQGCTVENIRRLEALALRKARAVAEAMVAREEAMLERGMRALVGTAR